jgi:cobalt transporter subunit CbtB
MTVFETSVLTRKDFWVVTGSLMVGVFAFYGLALDQGLFLSLFQGAPAFDANFIHELIHDTRHAAGFPCH